MVPAVSLLTSHQADNVVLECVLQYPAEACRSVLVDGLEDHQHGSSLENGGAYEAGQAPAPEDLAVEFGGRRGLREPGEATVYAPDDGTCGWVSAPVGNEPSAWLAIERGGNQPETQ